MKVFNLLNAILLDKQLIYIIIGIAAVLLVAIVVIAVCVVRARKKRNERDISKTDGKMTAEKDVAHKPVTKDAPEQPAPKANDEEEITQDDPEDLVAVEDENAQDVEEEIAVRLADGNSGSGDVVYRTIRYNRSFLARVTQASDEVKERYSALKNHILSYANVKPTLSWKRERFSIFRNTFACFVMRGKKICLCFATDPKRFNDTKYKVIDLSERSPKSKLPCKYRIISDRRVKYAKEIIDMLLGELSVEKLTEHYEQNYTMPYRETDALIEDGLIKVKIIEGVENTATNVDNIQLIKDIVKQTEQLPKRDFKILKQVEATEVNVMSDAEAAKLIEYKVVKRKKSKGAKGIINIDVLSKKFPAGARITIDVLHEMRVIPNNVNSIKVLAKGILDKPLIIEADDFSLQAVKMIALTGGRVIRTGDQ